MMQRSGIKVEVYPTAEQAAHRVAGLIASHIDENPNPVLGLATGGTPVPVYQELCNWIVKNSVPIDHLITFNLDEYIGLSPDHPQSYHAYMRQHLFDRIGLSGDRAFLPSGIDDDPQAAADQYEVKIAQHGGITLQLLGIGTNGHIGFNEPGSAMDSRTRVVDLAPTTIASNARYFQSAQDVPRQAISMGIGTIRDAKRIVLLATGEAKADAISGAINGPLHTSNPASLLQNHPDVLFVLDREAAKKLNEFSGENSCGLPAHSS